jgi:hypothetical protein
VEEGEAEEKEVQGKGEPVTDEAKERDFQAAGAWMAGSLWQG